MKTTKIVKLPFSLLTFSKGQVLTVTEGKKYVYFSIRCLRVTKTRKEK